MIDDFEDAMEAFADFSGEPIVFGRTHSAILVDGTYAEGGIVRWSDEGIWFWNGGPLSDFEPFLIPRAELDLDQFYAVVPGTGEAVRLQWHPDDDGWHFEGPVVPAASLHGPGSVARLVVWLPDPSRDPEPGRRPEPEERPRRRRWWRSWRRS